MIRVNKPTAGRLPDNPTLGELAESDPGVLFHRIFGFKGVFGPCDTPNGN